MIRIPYFFAGIVATAGWTWGITVGKFSLLEFGVALLVAGVGAVLTVWFNRNATA